jgi:hypothetical protein
MSGKVGLVDGLLGFAAMLAVWAPLSETDDPCELEEVGLELREVQNLGRRTLLIEGTGKSGGKSINLNPNDIRSANARASAVIIGP